MHRHMNVKFHHHVWGGDQGSGCLGQNSNLVCSINMAGTRSDLLTSRLVLKVRFAELSVLLRYAYQWVDIYT
jgi:hypothetical protein